MIGLCLCFFSPLISRAQGPSITYTRLSDTCLDGNRTLVATITDPDGVPVVGQGLPVLYWAINTSTNFTPVTGVSLGGGQYRFQFGAGAFNGNVVYYFIAAQDNLATPNVSVFPSLGASGLLANPPRATVPPDNPDFYVVRSILNGLYPVGVGQIYTTITDAIEAYNTSCLGGTVIFELQDTAYNVSENFPIQINQNPQASALNRLILKPRSGVNVRISGSNADALFKFNGADFVTIEGSGTSSTTRNLTLNNTSTSPNSVVLWLASFNATNGCVNDSIKNCIIQGLTPTGTLAGIAASSGSSVLNPADAPNGPIVIQNNIIRTSFHGVYLNGSLADDPGNVIIGNTIGSGTLSQKLGYRGVWASNQSALNITGNTIQGVNSTFFTGAEPDATAGIVLTGDIVGGAVQANQIFDIRNTSPSGSGCYAIALQSSNAATGARVINNFIHTIVGNGKANAPLDNAAGIAVISGGGYEIYFNSIHLTTNQSNAGITSALLIGPSASGGNNVRNNIFSNRMTTGQRYAVYNFLTASVFTDINYNNYFCNDKIGFISDFWTNLAQWQSATLRDANSVATDPFFVSATDLHVQNSSSMNGLGISIAGVTTDFDGNARANPPDIGADEFTPPLCSGNSGGTSLLLSSTVICISGAPVITCTGFSSGANIQYQWESSVNNTTWTIVSGQTNPSAATMPVINTTTYYRLRVTCAAFSATPGYSNTIMVMVTNPQITSTVPAGRCGPGVLTLTANGNAETTVQWFAALNGGLPIATGNTLTTPVLNTTTTYFAEATFIGSVGSCGPANPNAVGPPANQDFQVTPWRVFFDVLKSTTLTSVDVFPNAAGESFMLEIYNSSNTLVYSVPLVTTVSNGTLQTIPLNAFLLPGNDYYMVVNPGEGGTMGSGFRRNRSGAVYPYTSTDIVIIGNEFNAAFFMCFYNWKFRSGCSVPRVPVTATISNSAPVDIIASANPLCSGNSTTLTATSTNTQYSYVWTPGNQTGNSITLTPNSNVRYIVTGTAAGCSSSDTLDLVVNESPSPITLNPRIIEKCPEVAQRISVQGAQSTSVTVLAENFNTVSPGVPPGWDTATTATGTYRSEAQWRGYTSPYTYGASGSLFRSNDTSRFFMSISYRVTTAFESVLRFPRIGLRGYNNARLFFWHHYQPFDGVSATSPEIIACQVTSTPSVSTSWVNVWNRSGLSSATTYPAGSSTINFRRDTIDLSSLTIPSGSINPDSIYLRFFYRARADFWWAIDNIEIKGSAPAPVSWSPAAGLFENAAATIPYGGGFRDTIFARPASSTTYRATITTPNGCSTRDSAVITLKPPVTATLAGSTSICQGGSADITFTATGTGPWTCTLRRTNGASVFDTTFTFAASPFILSVTPAASGSNVYSILSLADQNGCGPASSNTVTITVSPATSSLWTGASTTAPNDWNAPANWCGAVPNSNTDVAIPAGLTNYPVITTNVSTSNPAVKSLTIEPGATLTITSSPSTPAVTGRLNVKVNLTNNGTLINRGFLSFNGGVAQVFTNNGNIPSMNVLEVVKSGSSGTTGNMTFNGRIPITDTGVLRLRDAALITLNDTITLQSTSFGTSRIDSVGSRVVIAYGPSGCFTIERFIPSGISHGKSWQLLATPTFGTGQSIKQAWQEGAAATASNPRPGYGTTITSDLPNALALGFDFFTPLGSTMRVYNSATNTYNRASSTSDPISNPKGYMFFVRGDRSVLSGTAPATPTTLRTTGKIYYGAGSDSAYSVPVAAGKFESAGNPYAAPIDFQRVLTGSAGINPIFYAWDPLLQGSSGLGGFQTISSFNGWTATPGGTANYSNTLANSRIQSGQAFFVFSGAGGTLRFAERNKVSGTRSVFRGLYRNERPSIRMELQGPTGTLLDGNLMALDSAASDDVDEFDAPKLQNQGENAGILQAGRILAIDARHQLRTEDTVQYALSQLKVQSYQIRLIPEHFSGLYQTAFLVDRYLEQMLPVSLNDTSTIVFSTSQVPASRASDRFYLVFRTHTVLPLGSIRAYVTEEPVRNRIGWEVTAESRISHYVVQRSTDAVNYYDLSRTPAAGNQGGAMHYIWTDEQPLKGYLYYRIRAVEQDGRTTFSNVVRAGQPMSEQEGITVFPNPVQDHTLHLWMPDLASGTYDIRMFNATGQQVLRQSLIHRNRQTPAHPISLPAGLSSGLYLLQIRCQGLSREFKIQVD